MKEQLASDRIYLDFNASSPLAAEVQEAMRPYLETHFGNPSSKHWAGRPARDAIEKARAQVAELLGAKAEEIVFTSGGSESNNNAIKGAWFAHTNHRSRIVTSAVEHPATLEPCRFLQRLGATMDLLPVDNNGLVNPTSLTPFLGEDLLLLTVMHANNEVGTIQPVRELVRQAHNCGALTHTDAAQSVGKIPVRVDDLGVDLLSLAGHKLYAPKGIGALYVRSGCVIEPLIHGAGHEAGRRSGTESVLLAAGLGAACELAARELTLYEQIREIRDQLWQKLVTALDDRVVLQGHPHLRLPNTLNVAFRSARGDEILARCPALAASTGAACHGGGRTLSDTLRAMLVPEDIGRGTVRLSLGRHTTLAETDRAADLLIRAYRDLTDR